MVFDIICGAILVLCGLIGYVKGIVRVAFFAGTLAAAFYGSQPLAPRAAGLLQDATGLEPDLALLAGRVLAGVAIYAVCAIASDLLARSIGRDETGVKRPWNRHLGGLAGLVVGGALVFAGLCVADALVHKLPQRQDSLFKTLRTSRMRRWVSDVNPLRNADPAKVMSDDTSVRRGDSPNGKDTSAHRATPDIRRLRLPRDRTSHPPANPI